MRAGSCASAEPEDRPGPDIPRRAGASSPEYRADQRADPRAGAAGDVRGAARRRGRGTNLNRATGRGTDDGPAGPPGRIAPCPPWTAATRTPDPKEGRIGRRARTSRQRGRAMDDDRKPRLLGVNHVALEVGDIEAALEFYGKVFRFELRGRGQGQVFLDMGDQFLALMEGRRLGADEHRHFGLVVDERSRVRALAEAAGSTLLEGPYLDFF